VCGAGAGRIFAALRGMPATLRHAQISPQCRPSSIGPPALSAAHDSRSSPYGARELALTLARLRFLAVAGQTAIVFAAAHWVTPQIAQGALYAGIGVLAVFAALSWWRLHRGWPVSENEVVAHLAVDIGVLCYLLYLTGGATNPFVSLYIMPVVLAATALSVWRMATVMVLSGGAYALLMFEYRPLPFAHLHDAGSSFNLHVLGMGIEFATSASLLGFFTWRLALALRERERAMQRERERALRDESILAIATQAAGAAHELNTPLSTIRTLIAELRRMPRAEEFSTDLDLLAAQTERCRDILREMVAAGTEPLATEPRILSLEVFADDCRQRFELLRPEVQLDFAPDATCRELKARFAPSLQHALVALLNNAADASAALQQPVVHFGVRPDRDAVEFVVRDFGSGLTAPARDAAGRRFFSDKRDGLGLGLALATATAERLDGELRVESPAGGGTLMRLRLPLRAAENSAHVG
jgi:two-component system sensor histidine kinase RegB